MSEQERFVDRAASRHERNAWPTPGRGTTCDGGSSPRPFFRWQNEKDRHLLSDQARLSDYELTRTSLKSHRRPTCLLTHLDAMRATWRAFGCPGWRLVLSA